MCLVPRPSAMARNVSDGASRTSCPLSDRAARSGSCRMLPATRETDRPDPETPVEDTGSHRLHRTICSSQGEDDIDVATPEKARWRCFRRSFRSAHRWESAFLPHARNTCAKMCRGRAAGQVRTRSVRAPELQPEPGRVRESRSFTVRENMLSGYTMIGAVRRHCAATATFYAPTATAPDIPAPSLPPRR
jgi:hypothetical protein